MSDSFFTIGSRFFIFYVPLLFALCVHEWAHARVALMKGDTLAQSMGRLSLNPLVHADVVGTVILPLLSIFTGLPVFGWAKPVPVDETVLKHPKEDMFWIALAGPLSNFCLALVSSVLLIILYSINKTITTLSGEVLITVTEFFIYLNLLLCFFNLIPLHPLDGGKILARFLPHQWNEVLEQQQLYLSFALIGLFMLGGFHILSVPLQALAGFFIFVAKTIAYMV